jgi:nicotinate-nucleotide adenylyltransferase
VSTVAIYGGSFNPPHAGHGMVAAWLHWTGLADEVWLVPSHSHPFERALAPFAQRLELCEALASTVGPWVHTNDIEACLEAPNYTYQMLQALQTRHPANRLRLVVGADILPDLPRWHRWSDIAQEFSPILVGRQGYATPEGAVDFPNISSTEVRRRIAAHEPVDHLLPVAVRERLGDLYQSPIG